MNESSFQKSPPVERKILTAGTNRKILEFILMFPFIIYPIVGNTTHLLLVRTHVVGSSVELAVYSLWWLLIWYWNTRSNNWRGTRLGVTLFFQWAIMVALRNFVY